LIVNASPLLVVVFTHCYRPLYNSPTTRFVLDLKFNLVGWLAGWLVGWLAGWLVGWLAGWLVGWLAGWLVIDGSLWC
jgi:hypothetical protein